MQPPYTAAKLNSYKHLVYNVNVNRVFLKLIGMLQDNELVIHPFDVLNANTQQYILYDCQIKSFAALFYHICTVTDTKGKSCIEHFILKTQHVLSDKYGMTNASAQIEASKLAKLFINGIPVGVRMRVVWNEDGVDRAYICRLGAAKYDESGTIGWVVNSETKAFDDGYPFDIVKDEWTIPASLFNLF